MGEKELEVLPIDDLSDELKSMYTKNEIDKRCKLASLYRLIDVMGWSLAIFNHISLRLSEDKDEFLTNPFSLLYGYMTASSLVRVDVEGNTKDPGITSLGVHRAGFVLHTNIFKTRPDINCVIHVHTPNSLTAHSMKCGFFITNQESIIIGKVSYHDYQGLPIEKVENEVVKVISKDDLGPGNMIMFLPNNGAVICCKDVESSFLLLSTLMSAARSQEGRSRGLSSTGHDELTNQIQAVVAKPSSATSKHHQALSSEYFEAHMGWLDEQGLCTGHVYKVMDNS